MSKRTTFRTISPLPAGISRDVVIDFLHNHQEMIDLNPLIIERHPIPPPEHAREDESSCVWWSMTDKISYLPGGLITGEVVYTAAFNDLPNGVQTHCYAPAGTDIRERWTLGGSLPGEPLEPIELGLNVPRQGLYLREDVELRCNFVMSAFVKRTLKKAHGSLVERLCEKAAIACSRNPSPDTSILVPSSNTSATSFQNGPGNAQTAHNGTYPPSQVPQQYPSRLEPPHTYSNSGPGHTWSNTPVNAPAYSHQPPAELQ
ncbi:hypothetical protein GGR57DRAFT_2670 [Xylariaceae sp. FL1272]|nr:hypothetical protein GGR57DRAFT_2670 [Xylariaceae sp. FL1272]